MININHLLYLAVSILVLLIAACSSSTPVQIKQSVDDSPSVRQVQESEQDYISQAVRWGGVIVEMENKENTSWLSIVAFPLNDDGKPEIADQSSGRFIAIVDKFLEPEVYSKGRQITVTGEYTRTQSQKVGDFSYLYPIVEVGFEYLWPKIENRYTRDYPSYWRYDPWFYPYYYPRHHHSHRHISKHKGVE